VKGPFLEATPPFETKSSLRDLRDEGIVSGEFAKITEDIHYERPLYLHQDNALRKAEQGENIIVATGTGSGKTECYLLPILNALMKEAEDGTLHQPGVRALLLFPMNALANDQLKRLRGDHSNPDDPTVGLLEHYPGITFGRYTGETPYKMTPEQRKDYFRKFGMEPLPNELLAREEMQQSPPHILLTNYAMLEYLLLRPDDSEFFDTPDKARHWRFLVIDEAHTYKGANGTEISMLLRRLKERISHHTSGRQLQCFATSATLAGEDSPESLEALSSFAHNLFDAEFKPENIITSKRIRKATNPGMYPYTPEEYQQLRTETSDLATGERGRRLLKTLSQDARIVTLHDVLLVRPLEFDDVAKKVFPDIPDLQLKKQSLARLVELAAAARKDDNSASLFPARYHLFIKSLDGMFASLYPDTEVFLDRREEVAHTGMMKKTVFELANCQRCSQEYIVGRQNENGYLRQCSDRDREPAEFYLRAKQAEADIDDDEEMVEDSTLQNLEPYRLCRVCGKLMRPDSKEDCCDEPDNSKYISVYRLVPTRKNREVNTCPVCGSISGSVIKRFLTANHAASFAIMNSLYEMVPPKAAPALPAPEAPAEDMGFFDFGGQPALEPDEAPADESGRKLLIFSDNRQEAAFFAGYADKNYHQLLWRKLMLRILKRRPEGLSIPDLIDSLAYEAKVCGLYDTDCQTEDKQRKLAGMYVMHEFLRLDRNTGLEGRGYVSFSPEPVPMPRGIFDLSPTESWLLLRVLMDSLRLGGAVAFQGQMNPKDRFFEPRNRPFYFREELSSKDGKVISFLPITKTGNRRSDYFKKVFSEETDAVKEKLRWCFRLFLQLKQNGYFKEVTLSKQEGVVYQINTDKWRIRYLPDEDELYRCERCGKLTACSVRDKCPEWRCQGTLVPVRAGTLRLDDPHYYALYNGEKLIPMTACEHTAQLSKEAAAQYQRDFESGKINVLSCSTTFEMGVDVGELEATFLRNVPPETANYIQRAGRAGRRTSSAAFSVTFARRSSHDLYFFHEPSQMISGKIKPPYIETSNEKIAWRHINSIVMAWFFKRHREFFDGDAAAMVGVAGGKSAAEQLKKDLLEQELSAEPSMLLKTISDVLGNDLYSRMGIDTWSFREQLLGDAGTLTKTIDQSREEIEQLTRQRNELHDARNDAGAFTAGRLLRTIETKETIRFLAEGGVLPKYGFPVDVVSLKVQSSNDRAQSIDLSRDLRIAIAEYAPPSEVDANKLRWKSGYINIVQGHHVPCYWYLECTRCGHTQPTHQLTTLNNTQLKPETKDCPACGHGQEMRVSKYLTPIFGFSTGWNQEPSRIGDSRPAHGFATRTQFWGVSENLDPSQLAQQRKLQLWLGTVPVLMRYSPKGELVVFNKGATGNGMMICLTCGHVPEDIKPPKAHENKEGNPCRGSYHLASLGHSYFTDILRLELPEPLSYSFGSDKSDAHSVLYALLGGASDVLGIARSDINGCISFDGRRPSLILFDDAAGGAGHMKKIAEHFVDVLRASIARVSNDCCSEETSCYACLRDYGNQYEHDRLTRGGALRYLSWLLENAKQGVWQEELPFEDAELLEEKDPSVVTVVLSGGQAFSARNDSWEHCAKNWRCPALASLGKSGIPTPDLCETTLCVGAEEIEGCLVWEKHKVAIPQMAIEDDLRAQALAAGWHFVEPDAIDEIVQLIRGHA